MNQVPKIQPMKRSIWDYLFYASMAVILIWLVLKMTGIIQTPLWLEYGVPIGSFVIGFIMLFQSLNDRITTLSVNDARIETRIEHIDKDVESLKTDVGKLKSRINC